MIRAIPEERNPTITVFVPRRIKKPAPPLDTMFRRVYYYFINNALIVIWFKIMAEKNTSRNNTVPDSLELAADCALVYGDKKGALTADTLETPEEIKEVQEKAGLVRDYRLMHGEERGQLFNMTPKQVEKLKEKAAERRELLQDIADGKPELMENPFYKRLNLALNADYKAENSEKPSASRLISSDIAKYAEDFRGERGAVHNMPGNVRTLLTEGEKYEGNKGKAYSVLANEAASYRKKSLAYPFGTGSSHIVNAALCTVGALFSGFIAGFSAIVSAGAALPLSAAFAGASAYCAGLAVKNGKKAYQRRGVYDLEGNRIESLEDSSREERAQEVLQERAKRRSAELVKAQEVSSFSIGDLFKPSYVWGEIKSVPEKVSRFFSDCAQGIGSKERAGKDADEALKSLEAQGQQAPQDVSAPEKEKASGPVPSVGANLSRTNSAVSLGAQSAADTPPVSPRYVNALAEQRAAAAGKQSPSAHR